MQLLTIHTEQPCFKAELLTILIMRIRSGMCEVTMVGAMMEKISLPQCAGVKGSVYRDSKGRASDQLL